MKCHHCGQPAIVFLCLQCEGAAIYRMLPEHMRQDRVLRQRALKRTQASRYRRRKKEKARQKELDLR